MSHAADSFKELHAVTKRLLLVLIFLVRNDCLGRWLYVAALLNMCMVYISPGSKLYIHICIGTQTYQRKLMLVN